MARGMLELRCSILGLVSRIPQAASRLRGNYGNSIGWRDEWCRKEREAQPVGGAEDNLD